MRWIVLLVLTSLFGFGCYPQKETFTSCCVVCHDLAAVCTQSAATYTESDPTLAIAASKECLGAYAECREACKP